MLVPLMARVQPLLTCLRGARDFEKAGNREAGEISASNAIARTGGSTACEIGEVGFGGTVRSGVITERRSRVR